MHKVLSHRHWKHVGAVAQKAKQRQVAIAYVTQDLIGFRKGDVLVTDASEAAISAGETDAKLLLKLARRGVALFSCPALHAKVLLLDEVAVIGSGNMSDSSRSALVEAAVMTDSPSIVSGVASLIEQLKRQSTQLDDKSLRALEKIKVVRRGFGRGAQAGKGKRPKVSDLGTQTWLVGVAAYDRDPTESEQQLIDTSRKELAKKFECDDESFSWIRWTGSGPFPSKSRHGDLVIQVWRKGRKSKRPSSVLRPRALLRKRSVDGCTFVFLREDQGGSAEMKWGVFKQFMKSLGYRRRCGPGSETILDPALADAIARNWKTVLRTRIAPARKR